MLGIGEETLCTKRSNRKKQNLKFKIESENLGENIDEKCGEFFFWFFFARLVK